MPTLYNFYGRYITECPCCKQRPRVVTANKIYRFYCCEISSGDFAPLSAASSAWADAVKKYIDKFPEVYRD
jgi:hypothetical protein